MEDGARGSGRWESQPGSRDGSRILGMMSWKRGVLALVVDGLVSLSEEEIWV